MCNQEYNTCKRKCREFGFAVVKINEKNEPCKTQQSTVRAYVGCDGPPYCLPNRLIEEEKIMYDWVAMLPGLEHLNMNQMKSFFKGMF